MTACSSCEAWFVWPLPTPAQLFEHYVQNTAGMPSDLRGLREGTSQSGWYGHLARKIARRANNVRSLVDVGAGGLELTLGLARQFPYARVEAWDLFADGMDRTIPPEVSGRVSLRRADLNALGDLPGKQTFDVVACVAVLEHVLDPIALLRTLRSLTAPGGFVFVMAPAVRSIAHRLLGESWPYYCPDEHLTLPSLESMRRALEICGGGRYELRRASVRYSLRYLFRFLELPLPVPPSLDILLPVPAGAFELIWYNDQPK
jgi:SAM-dependent methyltransferase